jgi:hypothetical protein
MSTKFYVGQKDYIAKLNEIDDLFNAAIAAPGTTATNVAAAVAARDAAIASATAALASQNAAAGSATTASGAATTATTKAGEASTDAAAVAAAKTAVDLAAANANNSAVAADASKTAAAGSATAAAASASTTSTTAASAIASKDAAGVSATAASGSATAAASSASGASGSASAASASATAASGSATTASTAAMDANNSASAAAADRLTTTGARDVAVGSKDIAVTKAGEAATSASSAAASASNAQGYQNTAGFHATNAATSEANATSSAAYARLSELNAEGFANTLGGATTIAANTVAANTAAGNAAASASQALAVYGTTNAMQAALNTAAAQSQLAQTAASSASSILQQDLSAVSAALHRSPNAVTAMCIYDTAGDTDGGAWVDRMGHTSWMNEALCGTWLPGGYASELAARGDNLLTHPDDFTNAVWVATGTGPTITQNASVAPDGTTSADKLVFSAVGSANRIANTVGTGFLASCSIHLKGAVGGEVVKFWDGQTTTVTCTLTTEWQRFTVPPTSNPSKNILLYADNAGTTVYAWGAKVNKVGELPSTYSASPELVSNGGFDNGTVGWAPTSAILSVIAGALRITATAAVPLIDSTVITTVSGKAYSIEASVIGLSTAKNITLGVGSSVGGAQLLNVMTGSAAGSFRYTFVATNTTTYIRISGSSAFVAADYFEVDNISVKEVTTLATPYVPYSTQTGSYYQSSADGKFYRLGAGYGALTEVFRGNKAKFPRLSAIVAEASNVTIYDLTEKGQPMWMRFAAGVAFALNGSGVINSAAFMNGTLVVGLGTYGLAAINFLSDQMSVKQAGLSTKRAGATISLRNTAMSSLDDGGSRLINSAVNAVALTVLPDAPFDVATGLQIPTIVAGTIGGISVIKHDGSVVNSAYTDSFSSLSIKGTELLAARGLAGYRPIVTYQLKNIQSAFSPSQIFNSNLPGANSTFPVLFSSSILATQAGNTFIAAPAAASVAVGRGNPASPAKSTVTYITDKSNTGHMLGNIKRAYLCNTEVESVTAPELVTNGTFDTGLAGWIDSSAIGASTGWDAAGYLNITSIDVNTRGKSDSSLFATVIGKVYNVHVEKAAGTASLQVFVRSGSGAVIRDIFSTVLGTAGNQDFTFVATSVTSSLTVQVYSAGTISVDNISVKEVIPDRSYKAAGASIYGTLVKAPVA